MPPEPKKPIEELLEASAKTRRAEFGADPKMPNPMRARLHQEIARVARKDEPETRARWFGMSWPRIAIGAAMAALVIGAPIMWWRARQGTDDSFRLAMDRTATSEELNLPAAPPLPVESAPRMETELDKTLSASAAAPGQSYADKGAASDETKSIELAKRGEEKVSALKKFEDAATETAPKSSQEVGSGISNPVVASSGSLDQTGPKEGINLRQQFSQKTANQTFRRDDRLQQAATVLDNFQVEQDGRQIRVVDADGSTYIGKIERLSQNDKRNLLKEKQNYAAPSSRAPSAKLAKDTDESLGEEFYFQATGYNGSLKKSLVFEGNYIVTGAPQQTAPADVNSKSNEQMPARIVGTAKIHGEPPVSVDAVSVEPK